MYQRNFNQKSYLEQQYENMTFNLTIEEWKQIRNVVYWEADKYKNKDDILRHKIKCIEYWRKNKKPLTY